MRLERGPLFLVREELAVRLRVRVEQDQSGTRHPDKWARVEPSAEESRRSIKVSRIEASRFEFRVSSFEFRVSGFGFRRNLFDVRLERGPLFLVREEVAVRRRVRVEEDQVRDQPLRRKILERGIDLWCVVCARKVNIRSPGKGDSNSHGARPVHKIISMIK